MSDDRLRLWDPLLRFCHWSLVLAFFSCYFFTEEGDGWHRWLGYYAVAIVVLRSVWGFIGTPAARWSDFWPTPARLKWHLRALFSGERYQSAAVFESLRLKKNLPLSMITGKRRKR
ncbi:cytochrome b/b6 domain-containing protein [Pseudomonas sp. UM16]|uniref:cytochrome b/b6 domain-containing protein n=1 Tax=Pseudomonas sp. UM16 TaxID=3158962 RepID=UPI0039900947